MTIDRIDLLLLRHLDPNCDALCDTPVEEVRVRFAQLIADGYIDYSSEPASWMEHASVIVPRYMRTESGLRRFQELLGHGWNSIAAANPR
jgi:hypothetical protein